VFIKELGNSNILLKIICYVLSQVISNFNRKNSGEKTTLKAKVT